MTYFIEIKRKDVQAAAKKLKEKGFRNYSLPIDQIGNRESVTIFLEGASPENHTDSLCFSNTASAYRPGGRWGAESYVELNTNKFLGLQYIYLGGE